MNILTKLIDQVRLTWRLVRDPRVPIWTKLIPALALLYVLSPLDFIPDILPVIGQIDDLTIMLASMQLMQRFVPEHLLKEHRDELAGKPSSVIIDKAKRS